MPEREGGEEVRDLEGGAEDPSGRNMDWTGFGLHIPIPNPHFQKLE